MPYSPKHKQDTRDRILESARRLFNRKGFSEVSIEEIMTHAGLTHGGFYRHFSGKDEVYVEAIRYFLCKKTSIRGGPNTPRRAQARRAPNGSLTPISRAIISTIATVAARCLAWPPTSREAARP